MAKKKVARKKVKVKNVATKNHANLFGANQEAGSARRGCEGGRAREIGGVRLEVGRAGGARVKRMVYPAGFRWSVHMKPIVGTDCACTPTLAFWRAAKSTSSTPTVASSNTRPPRSWRSSRGMTVGSWAGSLWC